jgi:putative nucleotidyltransferase with HDIG domain
VKAAAETVTGTPNQRAGRVVVWATVAGGALAALWSLAATLLPVAGLTGPMNAPGLAGGMDGGRLLLLFVALACAGELLKVDVYRAERRNKMSFSFGMAVCLAAVTALPAGAPLVNLAAAAVHVLLVTRQRNVEKALFNLANVTLAAGAASGAYLALAPAGGPFGVRHLLAALAAVAVHYAVNSGLLSLVVSLYAGRTLRAVMRESLWYSPIKIFLGLTGAFLGGVHAQIGMVGVAMFVVPLLLLRYSLSLYANQVQRTIGTLQQAKTDVEQARDAQEETVRELVQTVAMIIDARVNSVSGHSRRVARYATAIGKEMGLAEPELDLLYTAGLFHDLGKVGIPETILHKPARLTEDEYQVVKEHAQIGERLLSEVPLLAEVARMVGEHHERFDGTGYPRGQHGHQTSLGGRILVVADSMESMLADRPYAKGKTLPEAVRELQRCAGAHFDPEVVAATRRAIAALGADFFTGPADGSDGTSSTNSRRVSSAAAGAADRILREVFA